MIDLKQIKILGGIGALLIFIGVLIPFINIIGLILVFLAVKSISEITKDEIIYKNYMIYFILSIISSFIIYLLFFYLGNFSLFYFFDPTTFIDYGYSTRYLGTFFGIYLVGFLIQWIILIIGTIYLRKSYISIAEKTNVNLFQTTGKAYFIGAITMIIIIGFIIILIANILEIVAYFSLPEKLPVLNDKKILQTYDNFKKDRYCPDCGRAIPFDAKVCPYCGKQFKNYF